MIFGHFLEHFHRQIYGGVYDPGSHLADENGFRRDVIEALRKIKTPVIRWPGGCFVSAYPWKKGVGERVPITTKPGASRSPTASAPMSSCGYVARWAPSPSSAPTPARVVRKTCPTGSSIAIWISASGRRGGARTGMTRPSMCAIGASATRIMAPWEMGAKTADEWARLVLESAKMMKRVDHRIELAIASIPDLDWNAKVLREAGDLLDWISIHGYWSRASDEGVFEKGYDNLIARAFEPEARIVTVKHILGSLGYLGKLRIAFDEWNLRGWCHPNFMKFGAADHALMDANDINSNYNMADAVFTACFLNSCLRHCDVVGMANFSPVVNTVGAIFTHEDGIVLRPTYHVFDLFANHTYEEIVHSALAAASHLTSRPQTAKANLCGSWTRWSRVIRRQRRYRHHVGEFARRGLPCACQDAWIGRGRLP